jgi:hypothetical protein
MGRSNARQRLQNCHDFFAVPDRTIHAIDLQEQAQRLLRRHVFRHDFS